MSNVFIAERMASTKDGALLRSLQKTAAIENGLLVVKGALVSGERDLSVAGDVAALTNEVYITDGVPLEYDESTVKGLDDFTNELDKPFRARKAQKHDVFSVSVAACTPLSTLLVVGNTVETPATGNKFLEKESESATASFVAKIVALWTFGLQGRAISMVRLEVTKSL